MPFLTEVFERYRRMTGSLEEAVLEMYLQGVSTRKVEQIRPARGRGAASSPARGFRRTL